MNGICGGYNLQWAWATGYLAENMHPIYSNCFKKHRFSRFIKVRKNGITKTGNCGR